MKGTCSVALCLFAPLSGCGADTLPRDHRPVDAAATPSGGDYIEIESDSSFIVRLTNGQAVPFNDTLHAEPAGRDYSIEDVFEEIEAVLVHVQLWEGHTYLLLQRRSGDTIWIDSAPIFSPERGHFLTASMDLEAGYLPNRIRIYRASPDTIELEWSLEPEETVWGASAAEWIADDTLRFLKNVQQWGPEVRCVRTPMMVVRSETVWQIQALAEQGDTVATTCR